LEKTLRGFFQSDSTLKIRLKSKEMGTNQGVPATGYAPPRL